jgi:hypothetical protein
MFQFSKLCNNLLVGRYRFPHTYEGADYKDAHLDSPLGIQYGGGHDSAVFGKNVWEIASAAVILT